MDASRVEQLARDHKALENRPDSRDQVDTEAARREETKALEECLHQIAVECDQYCAAYNQVFGAIRVRSEAHADTVVVRSQLDQQDTIVFCRTHSSHGHSGNIEVHRYHYPEQPVDLPVGLRWSAANRLTLTYRDQDVTPAELVLELLSTFSEQIARGNRAAATPRGDERS